jgi:Ca2+-binding EF-hand superfamily protein
MAGHGTCGFGHAHVPQVVANSMFQELDRNQDKSLDERELSTLIEEKLGLGKERAEAALMLMDKGERVASRCCCRVQRDCM